MEDLVYYPTIAQLYQPSNFWVKGCCQTLSWWMVSSLKNWDLLRGLSIYSPEGPTTIPALRWELFRSRNLEAEKLPPTRATLMPHILRTNFVAMRDKSYKTSNPCLPPMEENGWIFLGEEHTPVKCLYKPAPVAVLQLIKCGCQASCKCKGQCSY